MISSGKSMSFLVIGIAFLVLHCTAPSAAGVCKTVQCYAGEYCKDYDCLPCEEGYYNSKKVHTDVSCQRWTQKSGAGWTVSKAGTRSMNIEWQCAPGYEENNSSGIIECSKIDIQPTPTSVSSTSNPEKGNSTDPTKNIPNDSHEDKSELIIKIIVGVSITVILTLAVFLLICYFKKKKRLCFSSIEQVSIKYKPKKGSKDKKNRNFNGNKNDAESETFFESGNAGNNANGSDSPSKSSDNSKKHNKNDGTSGQTVYKNKGPVMNPTIPDNDKGIELPIISLNNPKKGNKNGDGANGPTVLQMEDPPIDPEVDILDTSMPEELPGENSNTSHLRYALEEMFESLCKRLGVADGNKVIDGLRLKPVHTGLPYQQKFTKCLLEWISSPAIKNDRVLDRLDQLNSLLKNMERNDVVHDFHIITKGVTTIILPGALEEMCGNLCERLEETDGNKVMDELKLKPVDSGLPYKQKLAKCLLERISSLRHDEILGQLSLLKSVLGKIERNDIVHDFDKITQGVTRIVNHER